MSLSLKVVELRGETANTDPLRPNPGKEEVEEVQGSAKKAAQVTSRIIDSSKASNPEQSERVILVQKDRTNDQSCCSKKCSYIAGVAIGVLAVASYYTLQWANRLAIEMDIPT
ncbi:MAG TPA: hypothetical protein VLG49_04150 [Rhabdochlamydiaceae bacterium]|nr:hypothetical protein [Rhabdochlamydiaceae bacterium]